MEFLDWRPYSSLARDQRTRHDLFRRRQPQPLRDRRHGRASAKSMADVSAKRAAHRPRSALPGSRARQFNRRLGMRTHVLSGVTLLGLFAVSCFGQTTGLAATAQELHPKTNARIFAAR